MNKVRLPHGDAVFSSRGERGAHKVLTLKIVRALLEGPATVPDIMAQTEASDSTVRDTLRTLRELGMLRVSGWECGHGRPAAVYELTASGDADVPRPKTAVPAAERNRRSRARKACGMFAQLLIK